MALVLVLFALLAVPGLVHAQPAPTGSLPQHVIVDSMPAGGSGLTDAELRATPVPVSGTVTANAGTNLNTSSLALEATLQSVKTAVEIIDNFISGSRGLVTEDNSAAVLAAVQSIKTNTDALLASGAGGYVRQDSTATIAKESGGNLATIAAKDFATSSKQDTAQTSLSSIDTKLTSQATAALQTSTLTEVQNLGGSSLVPSTEVLSVQTSVLPLQVLPGRGLPLPLCNNVRRYNCQR